MFPYSAQPLHSSRMLLMGLATGSPHLVRSMAGSAINVCRHTFNCQIYAVPARCNFASSGIHIFTWDKNGYHLRKFCIFPAEHFKWCLQMMSIENKTKAVPCPPSIIILYATKLGMREASTIYVSRNGVLSCTWTRHILPCPSICMYVTATCVCSDMCP